MHKLVTHRIYETILGLLEKHPEGLRWSELLSKIEASDRSFHPKTVNGCVWKLIERFPDKVYKPSKGLFRLLKYKSSEVEPMARQITKKFYPKTRAEWKLWLMRHYKKLDEIWVILYKKSTGKQTVTYDNLLDEALCFGWIDSLMKGIDKEIYAVRFTPRKKNSKWSPLNRKRYNELLQLGLVTVAGKKAYENQ